jgi:hypothetical protein
VYEDSDNIHIVMELCKGGELLHAVGTRHYSERTVRPSSTRGTAGNSNCMPHCDLWLLCPLYTCVYTGRQLHAWCTAHHCSVPCPPYSAQGHQTRYDFVQWCA